MRHEAELSPREVLDGHMKRYAGPCNTAALEWNEGVRRGKGELLSKEHL